MQLELLLSKEPRVLPAVRAFAREARGQRPLEAADAVEIEKLTVAAVEDAIASAYPPGEEGSIRLKIHENNGRLEIRVRDYGEPEDIEAMERQLHQPGETAPCVFGCSASNAVDELHWLA